MLDLKVKCAQCQEIFWIPLGKWTQLCPKCGKIGLSVIEQHPHSPRLSPDAKTCYDEDEGSVSEESPPSSNDSNQDEGA